MGDMAPAQNSLRTGDAVGERENEQAEGDGSETDTLDESCGVRPGEGSPGEDRQGVLLVRIEWGRCLSVHRHKGCGVLEEIVVVSGFRGL